MVGAAAWALTRPLPPGAFVPASDRGRGHLDGYRARDLIGGRGDHESRGTGHRAVERRHAATPVRR